MYYMTDLPRKIIHGVNCTGLLLKHYDNLTTDPPTINEVHKAFNLAFDTRGKTNRRNSIYLATMHERELWNPLEEQEIRAAVKKAAETKDVVSVLDFGCGNGKIIDLWESIANDLAKQSKTLRVVAYEPSTKALQSLRQDLTNDVNYIGATRNYQETIHEQLPDNGAANKPTYRASTFQNDCLSITLVHANTDDDPTSVGTTLQSVNSDSPFDLSISFESLPFVETQKKRIATLSMLGDITNQEGVVYATFPSMHSKKWAGYKQEIDRRKQAGGNVGVAKEDGDILFNFMNKHVLYHLQTLPSMVNEAIRAGLNGIEAGVKQVWHQQHHQKQNGLSEKDSEIAKMVNQTIADSGIVKEAENSGSFDEELSTRLYNTAPILHTIDGMIQFKAPGKASA